MFFPDREPDRPIVRRINASEPVKPGPQIEKIVYCSPQNFLHDIPIHDIFDSIVQEMRHDPSEIPPCFLVTTSHTLAKNGQ